MRLYEDQPGGTIARARQLRREAPAPERRLLRALREAFPALKWRHQAPLGPYFADILCFSERLVIEVDGDTHVDTRDHDDRRTAFMAREGYHTVRFSNAEAMENIDGVLAHVSLSLRERDDALPRRGADGDSESGTA